MTRDELIEKLQAMPADALVIVSDGLGNVHPLEHVSSDWYRPMGVEGGYPWGTTYNGDYFSYEKLESLGFPMDKIVPAIALT